MAKKKTNVRIRKKDLKSDVIRFFQENRQKKYDYLQLAGTFNLKRQTQQLMLFDILEELHRQGFLDKAAGNRYSTSKQKLTNNGTHPDSYENILEEFDISEDYPEKALQAAELLSDSIPGEEYAYREDFRTVCTFTIDPWDAKDFDDALSLRKLPNGNWEVGVHIADVTYYVKQGSAIDREAEKRGTSIYLVDRTIPMLPERLSNGLCSLRPDEDKRCFSCIFEMNEAAQVKNHRIVRTVIRSDRRLNYEEALDIIQGKNDPVQEEIRVLNELAKKLQSKRFKNGAIRFESSEICFKVDEKGKPLEIHFKTPTEANNLIEEFMLLANKTVAEFIGKKSKKTFVYRIHDSPDLEKLEDVARFIRRFGHNLKLQGGKKAVAASINQLLGEVQGRKEGDVISAITIRAMAKAVYSTDNIGHYGLAFDHYTHFTSPIRRYPDMMVHRLLERYMSGGNSVNKQKWEEKCRHCSDMEMNAAQAERASVKYKQIEFMSERIGNSYEGVISGITDFGFFVEIVENKCEGLVPMRDLNDDYYEFDEQNYCLRGRREKKVYRLGDPVKVQVLRANLEKRQLDFKLINREENK
ncbi:MAG TPA: ribonuclease R [Bacteroidales bacterium]|nr:ribonuclease R [Bacteroidales bacterium]HOD25802.1 ribonuclease R [Bacteroidales bacterium]HPH56969.1 ribonuclease R [Bacteroidales bacterium]HPN46376.1 ribonuclease R [Bacteroidales bacterium]HQM92819.1 ribonuclease R [Bacteroidales bacterium]